MPVYLWTCAAISFVLYNFSAFTPFTSLSSILLRLSFSIISLLHIAHLIIYLPSFILPLYFFIYSLCLLSFINSFFIFSLYIQFHIAQFLFLCSISCLSEILSHFLFLLSLSHISHQPSLISVSSLCLLFLSNSQTFIFLLTMPIFVHYPYTCICTYTIQYWYILYINISSSFSLFFFS